MTYRIDWSGRALDYTDDEIETIVDVARSADPLTQGAYLSNFEKKIKKYLGVNNIFGLIW